MVPENPHAAPSEPRAAPQTANPMKTALITHLVDEQREAADFGVAYKNPLDESDDFNQLCEACRRGDVKTVQSLIAFKGVNVNAVDRYDYPPLTLASLCGHYEVVQLLLESGAVCERDTFQGERCLYNALNDRIRNLLLQYDYSKSSDRAQPWAAGVSSLLARVPLDTADVTVIATSTSTSVVEDYRLHKFLLSARSSYFHRKFQAARVEGHGGKPHVIKTVRLPSTVDAKAFEIAIKHLYLGEVLEVPSQEVLESIERLTRHLDLPDLWDFMLVAGDLKQRRQKRLEVVEKAQGDLEKWFNEFVLGRKVVVDEREGAPSVQIGQNNDSFADVVLQADADVPSDGVDGSPVSSSRRTVLYPVHKAMLRSEFFTTMFTSQFREGRKPSSDDEALPIIPIDASPEVLELVLSFFYSEKTEVPLEHALDTLFVADQLLIERLKTKCAQIISTLGNTDDLSNYYSIYDVIRAGWALRVHRLEEFGAKYIAEHLEEYIGDDEFAELVLESAERIRERQETDTIELIDDIRFYLDEFYNQRMDDIDVDEMYEGSNAGEITEDSAPRNGGEPRAENGNGAEGTTAVEEAARKRSRQAAEEVVDEDDFFRQQAIQYNSLIDRIDGLLESLKLEA